MIGLNAHLTQLICKTCQRPMVGYAGDEECMDCAFPMLRKAQEAAGAAMVEAHNKRTGENLTASQLARRILGIPE